MRNALKNATKRQRDTAFVLLMLSLPILQFIVFWIVPNFNSILMAFQNPGNDGFTLINFKRFWMLLTEDNSSVAPSIKNTVILFISTNFVNLPVVMFLSFVLFKKVPGYKLFRVIFYLCTVYPLHIGWCVLLGLVGAVMGQLGDLSFSVIKRQQGIKDYGRLLPGHGGVLDRFDSVIFAAPVIWLIVSHVTL